MDNNQRTLSAHCVQTVRDTIESIDLIREMIDQLDGLEYADTANQVEEAFSRGKVAALIGMEG